MANTLPAFTPLEDSLFLTLYARALDNRRPIPSSATPQPTRSSTTSTTTTASSTSTPTSSSTSPSEPRSWTRWPRGSWLATPTPSGLTWAPGWTPGCSASPRRHRRLVRHRLPRGRRHSRAPAPGARNAHVIGADVTDPDWLDTVPTGRPAVIVADGMMAFLTQDELVSLWNRLISHFPSGEIVFNSYTRFAIWVARHARAPSPSPTSSSFPAWTTPCTRRLEPQTAAGGGDPAQPGTRGRRVPTGLAPVPPAGSAQHRLVPDGNHRPALPLLRAAGKLAGRKGHRPSDSRRIRSHPTALPARSAARGDAAWPTLLPSACYAVRAPPRSPIQGAATWGGTGRGRGGDQARLCRLALGGHPVVDRVVHWKYLGLSPSKPSAPNASLNLDAKASMPLGSPHTETVKEVVTFPTPAWNRRPFGSGMGDPSAQLAL